MQTEVNNVKLSFGRCLISPTFFDDFYSIFFNSSPEIRQKFVGVDMAVQKSMLRNGLTNLIMYSKGSATAQMTVNRLAKTHASDSLDIPAWMYDRWVDALLKVVKMHDKQITEQLLAEWEQSVRQGIEVMLAHH